MRIRAGLMIGMTFLLCGASCLPLFDGTVRPPVTGNTFAVAITEPLASRSVPEGTRVQVGWAAANLTGIAAEAYVFVESRVNLKRTRLAENLDATASGLVEWDTTGFAPGPYALVARLRSAMQTVEFISDVRITVDVPPELEFRTPTSDVTFTNGGAGLRVRYVARDRNGSGMVRIGLDPDDDHTNGNEFIIDESDVTATNEARQFDFAGNTTENEPVPDGDYRLYAELDDSVNVPTFVEAGVIVTVQ